MEQKNYINLTYINLTTDSPIKILSIEDVFQSDFTKMKAVASANTKRQKDLMYIDFVLCHEGSNLNNYYFFRDELEQAYESIVYKNYNWEHTKNFIGAITDSILIKPPVGSADPRWRIECGAVVWKWVVPDYAREIAEKAPLGMLRNSMECYFEDYVYVIGDEDVIYTKEERPDLEDYFGRFYNGVKVYKGFKNMFFGGAGVVKAPADPDAIFKSVAGVIETNLNSDNLIDFITNDVEREVLNMGQETPEVINLDESIEESKEVATEIQEQELPKAKDEVKEVDQEIKAEAEEVQEEEPLTEEEKDELEDVEENENEEVKEEAGLEAESEEEITEQSVDENENAEAKEENEVKEEKAEIYKESAAYIYEILEFYNITSQWENLFQSLKDAIINVIWDEEIIDKNDAVSDEVMLFVSKLFALFPAYLNTWAKEEESQVDSEIDTDTDTTTEEGETQTELLDTLSEKILELQQSNEELKEQLEAVQKEFNGYKETIELEKEEAEKEKLAETRLHELASLGCVLEGEKKSRIKEKLKVQNAEDYEDFKSLLLDVATSKEKKEPKKSVSSLDLAALNIESKKISKEERFKDLAKAIFNK